MKSKPWVYTGPMVRAIMAGRKTMSRRIMRVQPEKIHDPGEIIKGSDIWWGTSEDVKAEDFHKFFCFDKYTDKFVVLGKPPFQPGEIRYVAEGYQIKSDFMFWPGIVYGKYLADSEPFTIQLSAHEFDLWNDRKKPWMKTPGRFMYHSLARTYLEILRVWPERIQDISMEDCVAEGIQAKLMFTWMTIKPFKILWNSIHSPDAWERNDMVWAVEFERCEKPEED